MWRKFQALPSYFGGKRRLVGEIFKHLHSQNGTLIDAFLGGGSVSLYAKAKGFKVIANDIAFRSFIIGKALIENSRVKLEDEDVMRLFEKHKHNGFVRNHYVPKLFTSATADFLDNAVVSVREIENETKQHLLYHLLIKFILCIRQFGKFGHTRDTIELEKGIFDWSLRSKSHAPKNLRMIEHPLTTLKTLINQINTGIFDNHQKNEVRQEDVFEFLKRVKGDVAYFDPPYPGSSAYEDEYRVLDSILADKEQRQDKSVFSKADALPFIDKMLISAKHIPRWIISLGQTNADVGVKPEELLALVKTHRTAALYLLKHKWSVANAGGRDQSDNIEYLVVTKP